MNKFSFAFFVPAETDACPAGLKIQEIAAGRNFTVSAVGRQPDFQVIFFAAAKPKSRYTLIPSGKEVPGALRLLPHLPLIFPVHPWNLPAVNFTSSTLLNWCWQIRPRVSRRRDPPRRGNRRCRQHISAAAHPPPVSLPCAGLSRNFRRRDQIIVCASTRKASSANLGSCPVPVMLSLCTIKGGKFPDNHVQLCAGPA